MGRPVIHWELVSKNPGKVAEFYEKALTIRFSTAPK